MAKSRGKVTRKIGPSKDIYYRLHGAASFEIVAWCPDAEAKLPPEQVHLIFDVPGFTNPIVTRFKSPDTLGFLIEELARYRKLVWPNSEALDCSGNPAEE